MPEPRDTVSEFYALTLGLDLATTASRAAVALDDLTLGRDPDLAVVKRLAEDVALNLIEESTADMATAVVVRRALIETMPQEAENTTLADLRKNARDLIRRLKAVAQNGAQPDMEELARLRSVCVALSRNAMGSDGPAYERSIPQAPQ